MPVANAPWSGSATTALLIATGLDSPASESEQRLLGFCHGDVPNHVELEVRQVRQFIGGNDCIDDCRAFDCEGGADSLLQFIRLSRSKSVTPAGLRKCREV